jgi:hypothetical protein
MGSIAFRAAIGEGSAGCRLLQTRTIHFPLEASSIESE